MKSIAVIAILIILAALLAHVGEYFVAGHIPEHLNWIGGHIPEHKNGL